MKQQYLGSSLMTAPSAALLSSEGNGVVGVGVVGVGVVASAVGGGDIGVSGLDNDTEAGGDEGRAVLAGLGVEGGDVIVVGEVTEGGVGVVGDPSVGGGEDTLTHQINSGNK